MFRARKKLRQISLDVSSSVIAAPANPHWAQQLASGLRWASVGVCMAVGASQAWGQCVEQQKLTASDAARSDQFGYSVSVNGDTAVVGAIYGNSSPGGAAPGSAYVYVRTGGVWTEQQELTAPDGAVDDVFGYSVSVSGDTAVVGMPNDDDAGYNSGSAYVYVRSGGVWTLEQKLTASDAAAADNFGVSVSVSGDTAVVGAPFDDGASADTGSAYVFVRSEGVWTQQQKLTPSDPVTGDNFGVSVSVSGDTAVVGTWYWDGGGGADPPSSAYVYVRSGGVWTQQQKLTAPDAAELEAFGHSVSVSGDTAVIGAYLDNDAGYGSGSAYVFVRSGGVWTQQQKLTASDAAVGDVFGFSVSVSGDTAVIGAYGDGNAGGVNPGSAYVFVRSGGVWTQQHKLTASDAAASDVFGQSVSVSGDTVVVGAFQDTDAGANSGSAYVFQCAAFCPTPDCSNHGTCDNGCVCDTGYAGAGCDQCAPDYYNYPTCTPCLAAATCSSHGTCNALGGCDCNTGFAGAACDSCGPSYYNYPTCTFCQAATTCSGHGTCNAMGGCDCDLGFDGPGCGPCVEAQKLTASDASAYDTFGRAVSVSGDTAVVGALLDDHVGTDSGSAYVYFRSGGLWTQQQKLTALDAAANDLFGVSVSVSGDTAVVGAEYDGDAGFASGSAYAFVRSGGVWTQQQKLTASDAAADDRFGISVSVSGDTAVVGALLDNHAGGDGAGSAYAYVRTGAVWTQQQKLTASDAAANDLFGVSVYVSGNTAVVGANGNDDAGSNSGSAYVFVRTGGLWTQQQKLTASDAAADDGFGYSVSVSGDTAVVGASGDDDAGPYSGSAYVFARSGEVWTQQQKLTASDAAALEVFGISVSVSGNTVVVGASPDDDACPGCFTGSAYVFARSGGVWTEQQKLTASDAAVDDRFGVSVSVSGDAAAVGANQDDDAGADSGSAYVFSCAQPGPTDLLPDPSGINKTRFTSFSVPGGAGQTALRVKLVSLHHVVPPYTGGASVPFTSFEGQVRWVGPPAQYVESTSTGTPFRASTLQCAPHYQDWSTVGLLHVTGSAIVPSSIYEVENVAASCAGVEASCTAVSAPLSIGTTRWGDVETPYNPPSTSTQPDVGDIAALVKKFQSGSGAPIKARAFLAGDDAFGNITTLGIDLGFGHIAACVDAFRGKPYPFTISACP